MVGSDVTGDDSTVVRREIHNCVIDERLALAGLCGTLHLPSGRVCSLPALHGGACVFAPRGHLPATTATAVGAGSRRRDAR